jgi:DGQHR domain-containing protein|nr:DNA sulfur modification protein DndB [Kofleriaceae bacterium]
MSDEAFNAQQLEAEAKQMFQASIKGGLIPMQGVRISPEQGKGIGQFVFTVPLTTLCEITRDPFPYLGGATRSQKEQWSTEEHEYADLYQLVQRDFSNKKRKNVDSISDYVRQMIESNIIGFLPSPILWFQEEDIVVTDHFLGVKRTAYPHVIDGSTRVAAIHKLKRDASREFLQKMEEVKIPVLAIFGPDVDEDTAAQIFCDVNYKAIPVDPSLAKSMDKRDIHVRLAKEIEKAIAILNDRVSPRRQLTASDTRLFTKYALFQSLRCFTDGVESLDKSFKTKTLTDDSFPDALAKAIDCWTAFEQMFSAEWLEPDAREKYLHLQAPVLKAVSAFMRRAYFPQSDTAKKQECLAFLRSLDWSRMTDGWMGIVTTKGAKTIKVINNDPVVRDLAKRLEQHDSSLPRKKAAAAA